MRLMLIMVACVSAFSIQAETLSEAVQHSLILNPDVILSTTNTNFQSVAGLALQTYSAKTLPTSAVLNDLNLKSYNVKKLKTQRLADNLALEVSEYYFSVLLESKLLNYAQTNLRLHRELFLSLKQQKDNGHVDPHYADIIQRLARAETEQLKAEERLKQAKAKYAKVVGYWPHNLQQPPIPTNKELPTTLAEAIEQGLDNYPLTNSLDNDLKQHAMTVLTKRVRLAWQYWTKTGLDLIQYKKNWVTINDEFTTSQERFKQHKLTWQGYLDAQTKLFQQQKKLATQETNESFARFRLLDTMGKLITFINTPESEEESTITLDGFIQKPYPNYKPSFSNAKDQPRTQKLSSSVWYISAGVFNNKANALALSDKLKGLGFIAFVQTNDDKTTVFIGPYHYLEQANKGIKRLKEVAHVDGFL